MSQSVLITGASGFIGQQLTQHLLQKGHKVTALVRRPESSPLSPEHTLVAPSFEQVSAEQLKQHQIQAVIHLAAKVHDLSQSSGEVYYQVNKDATLALAQQCKDAGVGQFVFLSSIKVNGEQTFAQGYSEAIPAAPEDDYGRSKWQAEQGLAELACDRFKVASVRIPLVYGAGVKANFAKLVALVAKLPVTPFGAVHNRRSLLGIPNLLDFLHHTLQAGEQLQPYSLFCVSDPEPLSLPKLMSAIAKAQGKAIVHVPIPSFLFSLAFTLIGKKQQWHKLSSSLEVAGENAATLLHWQPKYSSQEQLNAMLSGGKS